MDKGGGSDVIGEFKPFEMGMQVSCGVYPERAEERVVWEDPEVSGSGVARIGTAVWRAEAEFQGRAVLGTGLCSIDGRV